MPVRLRYALLAIFVGAAAYLPAGRRRRAAVMGVLTALAVVGFAYAHYLAFFADLDLGGDSARALTLTAVKANTALLKAWPLWLPGSLALLAAAHACCALDRGYLALWSGRRTGSATRA